MSLGNLNFDQIAEAHLQALIETGVPEGIALDYKRKPYGRTDADVKEFLKDVSSFANSVGGHLVVGRDEAGGVAAAIAPIIGLDADQEVQRLENLMRDGIEPRVSGIRTRAVPIATGGFAIVIRIPKSWNPPHRVSARNTNRFYARNSAGAHEVTVEELRVLFNVSATAQERIRAFRQERLAKVTAGETPVALAADRGKLLLHIVPLSAFSARPQVELQRAQQLDGPLRPIASIGFTPRFNFDGFITIRGGDASPGCTQLFRNGIIEAVKVRLVIERPGHLIIPTIPFDKDILDVVPRYFDALRSLEVPPPIVVMLTLEGVSGAVLGVSPEQFIFEPPVPISQSVLELPEIIVEDYGTSQSYERALRPAFDALWNAGGFAASQYFSDEGVWTGPPKR
jgi:hypothetical protein